MNKFEEASMLRAALRADNGCHVCVAAVVKYMVYALPRQDWELASREMGRLTDGEREILQDAITEAREEYAQA